eukprot:CAMPEP_0116561624 /NCGR_PEP_ID=MMETSP0397-20121206/11689_1 /TAXON_ID=216820 /ORGANISM="Cyclophora tenuis, Strain ECT3854" /LENGTH=431 /DNA_ID=CAMNT_0004087793 /DNA_START=56 /DNA_END=1351 /DNA_ORIENTATION=+
MSYGSEEPDLGHPDSAIRLASAVHRFKVPIMTKSTDFEKAFKTVGTHAKTKAVMKKATDSRQKLDSALLASTLSGERIYVEATRYLPLIHQILITCKVQPEAARLDERLLFEWKSGVEKTPEKFSNEALMYDMVMCICCQALGKASTATEASIAGEFAQASREYSAAAGIFQFLAEDHLPKWIAKGANVEPESLPTEATVGPSGAFVELFLANAQQMAVATVLIKPGTPNYSLLAKLCYGIYERLEAFMQKLRKAFDHMQRLDEDFFTLITFQSMLQLSLCGYFHARSFWDSSDYGMAIAMLSEANILLKPRTHAGKQGMPEIGKGSPLVSLEKDLKDLRAHYGILLKSWESDNSSVYFESVPRKVPEEKKLSQPLMLSKPTPYTVDEQDPLPLVMPGPGNAPSAPPSELTRGDSDLARRLQEQLNAGHGY